MAFINKLLGGGASSKVQEAAQTVAERTPVFRFGGWQTMGAHTRPVDTRTTEQLLINIDYFAQRNPEVAQFKKELKSMKPEHLGLVSDICELANRREMLNTNIDIKAPLKDGEKSLFALLIEKLPKASKENPEALNFAQEVINQTDSTASKFFLNSFVSAFEKPEAAKHLQVTKPYVKDIAEGTLKGGYTMDYSKERNFVKSIAAYLNSEADTDKIKMLTKILKLGNEAPIENLSFDGIQFVHSKAPISQVEENMKVFPKVAEIFPKQTGEFNLTDFLTRNVNLD